MGIRFFKMQLSEVIVHTRELFRDVTGKDKVMALEQVTPEQIEQRLHIDKDQEEYKKFLSGMDYDKKGWDYRSRCTSQPFADQVSKLI